MECKYCDKKLENNSQINICKDCKRISNTQNYLIVAFVILFLGLVAGVVFGNLFSTTEYGEEVFNVYVMLFVWISTISFDIFIFAIHSICYRLDLLIDKKN